MAFSVGHLPLQSILEYFHYPKKKPPHSLTITPWKSLPPPALDNQSSTFCLYRVAYFGHFM